MPERKTHEEIEKEIQEAENRIQIGGIYSHFKNPENRYKVIGLATQEATEKLCVIYQAEYGKKLLFIRDLDSWLERPLLNGKEVKRFQLVI